MEDRVILDRQAAGWAQREALHETLRSAIDLVAAELDGGILDHDLAAATRPAEVTR